MHLNVCICCDIPLCRKISETVLLQGRRERNGSLISTNSTRKSVSDKTFSLRAKI